MGLGPQHWPPLTPDEDAQLRQQGRVEAALRNGWQIRQDPVRLEFIAAREMVQSRTLDGVLDKIEKAG